MAANPTQQAKTGVARIAAGGFLSQQQAGYADPAASYSEQAKARNSNPLSSVFNTGLSVLSRGAQLAPRYINSLRKQGDSTRESGANFGSQLAHLVAAQPRAIGSALQGVTDLQGKNDISFSHAVTGHEASNAGQKITDLGTSILLDPTTYMGVGLLGDAAKAAKAAVGLEHGTAAAAQLGKAGTAGLSDVGKAKVAATIASEAAKAADAGAQGDRGIGKLVRNVTGRSARSAEEKFIQDATKDLARPAGLHIKGGRTLLSTAQIGKAADVLKLGKAANTVRNTKVGESAGSVVNGLRKLVTPRLDVIQDSTFGSKAAGQAAEAGANTARSRGLAVTSAADAADLAHVKAAIAPTTVLGKVTGGIAGGTNISKEANAAISDALDTGEIPKLIQHFMVTGQETAAKFAKHLDDVRHDSTERYVASGLADASKLHDTNAYAARIPAANGAKWLAKNAAGAARSKFAYDPAEVKSALSNAAPQLRNLPDMPISELNKYMESETGVKNFFEADPAKRILGRSAQINQHIGEAARLKELAKVTVDGKPLAIISNADETSEKATKALTQNYKQTHKALDAEIGKALKDTGHEAGLSMGIRKGLSELDSAAARQAGKVARTRAALTKLADSRKLLQAGSDAAQSAGTVKTTDRVSSAADSLREATDVLSSLKETPTISRALIESAVEDAALARKALQLAKGAETARAGSKGVQHRIGAAKAYAVAAGRLEKKLQTIQTSHQAELDKLTQSADKLFGAVPAGAKDRVAALRRERSALFQSFKEQKAALRESAKTAVPAGYVKIPSGPFGNTFMPQSIASDVISVTKMFDSDVETARFAKAATAMTNMFRNLAINTLIVGSSTAALNATSDVMMMVVRGGMKDPISSYKTSGAIIRRAIAAEKAGKHVSSIASDPSLSSFDSKVAAAMIKEGTLTTGLFNTDVGAAGVAATGLQKLAQAANISGRGSVATKHMGQLNQIVSNANRAALFADNFARTGNSALAARNVREALIDYTDLTKHEKGVKRFVMPFYTFAARNLTNAVWDVAHVPGRTLTLEKLRQGFFGQEDPSGAVPDYALANDQRPLLNVGGTPILSNIQSPLQAAAQLIQPIADIASTLPGLKKTEGGFGAGAGGLLANVGGFESGGLKSLAQEKTGTDLFTGAPLDPTQSPWKRLAQSQIPSEKKGESIIKDYKGGDRAVQTARTLSMLGISSTANTDQKQTSEQYRRINALGTTAKSQGIPTATALRKSGKLAPSPKKKAAKRKKEK